MILGERIKIRYGFPELNPLGPFCFSEWEVVIKYALYTSWSPSMYSYFFIQVSFLPVIIQNTVSFPCCAESIKSLELQNSAVLAKLPTMIIPAVCIG